MRSTLKNIIIKPLEWHLLFLGIFVISLFYLQIVVTPTVLLALIGLAAFNFLEYEMALYVLYSCGFIGVILGFIWAERIRKTLGIVTFTAYLLSTPEIDGWRDTSGNRVKRKVT